jgi:hypothetical protein
MSVNHILIDELDQITQYLNICKGLISSCFIEANQGLFSNNSANIMIFITKVAEESTIFRYFLMALH